MFKSIVKLLAVSVLAYCIGWNITKGSGDGKIYLTLQDTACKNPGEILDPAMLMDG